MSSVDLYEIKDSELDILEKGSPTGLFLDFAVFLLSIAFSALVALCTTEKFKYPVVQTGFVVVLIVGGLGGALLLLLWHRGRASAAEVIAEIRKRIPPDEVVPASTDSEPDVPEEEPPESSPPKT